MPSISTVTAVATSGPPAPMCSAWLARRGELGTPGRLAEQFRRATCRAGLPALDRGVDPARGARRRLDPADRSRAGRFAGAARWRRRHGLADLRQFPGHQEVE